MTGESTGSPRRVGDGQPANCRDEAPGGKHRSAFSRHAQPCPLAVAAAGWSLSTIEGLVRIGALLACDEPGLSGAACLSVAAVAWYHVATMRHGTRPCSGNATPTESTEAANAAEGFRGDGDPRRGEAFAIAACLLLGLCGAAAGAEPAFEAGMPNPPAAPTTVRCAMLILDVVDIDDVDESFEAEIALVASWHDPRLAFDAEAEGTDVKLFQGGFQFAEIYQGWWPQLVIVNQVGSGDTNAIAIKVMPDGEVRYIEQRSAVFETPMQLHDYPFDTQQLRVTLVPFGNTVNEVVLEVDERYAQSTDEFVRRNGDVNVAGWDLQHLTMMADDTFIATSDGPSRISRMVTTIQLQRRSWQLVWQMLFPLLVIVSMIWSIFWIDSESLADRLNVSFIGVLTIVAYQFVVIENMPRMSYLTFTDTLLLVSFVTMAATIPQSLAMHALERKGRQAVARRIDRICRWAFPATYLLLIGGTVAWYATH
jgi:hypothetical protein